MMRRAAMTALAGALLAGCATTPQPASPQDQFFAALSQHCGKAYAGRMVSHDASDAEMRGKPMVMHVRQCTPATIRIPFHIDGLGPDGGWDRSRTWVISRAEQGLQLKHDHRHADGKPDQITQYGGVTAEPGSASRQSFPVDAESITLFRANNRAVSVTNVWAVEVDNQRFAYGLRREGRHFRVEFDLGQPVPPPPAPWGW
jgi:hypothetical protein